MSSSKDSLFDRPAAAKANAAPGAAPPTDDARVKRALVDVLAGAVTAAGIEDFGQLKQRFIDAGLEAEFRSWMTRRPNQELNPARLRTALAPTQLIDVLARRTGLPEDDLVERLSMVLPRLVNEVTPFGADDAKAVRFHLLSLRKRLRA